MPEITFHVTDQVNTRYKKLSKTIRSLGMSINQTVPYFLIDKLESDGKKRFFSLKKYIGEKSE